MLKYNTLLSYGEKTSFITFISLFFTNAPGLTCKAHRLRLAAEAVLTVDRFVQSTGRHGWKTFSSNFWG